MPEPDAPGPAPSGQPGAAGQAQAAPVLAIVRFRLPADQAEGTERADAAAAGFAAGAERALAALAQAAGYRAGRLARAVDDPAEWVLVTEWAGPGAWRRALSRFDVRVELTPLLAHAVDAPGAFEVLVGQDGPDGATHRHGSSLASDAATAAPGGR